ncbi:hypothetical protein O7605_30040 [Verrucosispora sp. WMMA2121]|nr:hypothetical protein [Verrucosispora sp. WMMA2121]MCZ7423757.1 hypothetical protein [Verrucosispora sp. WMMA2121]
MSRGVPNGSAGLKSFGNRFRPAAQQAHKLVNWHCGVLRQPA